MIKKLKRIQQNQNRHWVGDGFPVRSIFSYAEDAEQWSPFLLLDYAGPAHFPSTHLKRGVGEHPHRGFETVTVVYQGEVEHRDSSGGGGKIGPGEVQWMTAGSGVVHEEFHGREFAKTGGIFEVIQLWVNLPKKFKMTPPRYQGISKEMIPQVLLENNAGTVRVISGAGYGVQGPALTFSPVTLWDYQLKKDQSLRIQLREGDMTALLVLKGQIEFEPGKIVSEGDVALMAHEGDEVFLKTTAETTLLLLSGEPIQEPIVGAGPFVMNTESEIRQAFDDYRRGKMGHLIS